MGTPFQAVYDAFSAKILEDEWYTWIDEMVEADMRALLEGAIPFFKFPKHSLDRDDNGFIETLTPNEIQILAGFMKIEWLNRTILSWNNLKPLYSESDFSQANLISQLNKLLQSERANTSRLESLYYRSIDGKPYSYNILAGDN